MSTVCPKCGTAEAWDGKSCTSCPPSAEEAGFAAIGYAVWGIVTIGLGWLSWTLDRHEFWRWTTPFAGVMLAVAVWQETRKDWEQLWQPVTQARLKILGCGIITWLAWTLPPYIDPSTPVWCEGLPKTSVRILYDDEIIATLDESPYDDRVDYFRRRGFDVTKLRLETLKEGKWVELKTTHSKDTRRDGYLFYDHDVLVEVQ